MSGALLSRGIFDQPPAEHKVRAWRAAHLCRISPTPCRSDESVHPLRTRVWAPSATACWAARGLGPNPMVHPPPILRLGAIAALTVFTLACVAQYAWPQAITQFFREVINAIG